MAVLIPPGAPTGAFSDGKIRGNASDLWRFYGFSQGLALVKSAGIWTLQPTVVIDEAEAFFQGGMAHVIDSATVDELTAAGFGAYIKPADNEYGGGPYGAGAYGS